MSNHGSAYDRWEAARQLDVAQQERAREAAHASELPSSPRNFLPPHQRKTWMTPAGQSEIARRAGPGDERPAIVTAADDARHRNAQIARAIEAAGRMSGSSSVRNPKLDAQRGWHPVTTRDRFGRIVTSWERDDPRQAPPA